MKNKFTYKYRRSCYNSLIKERGHTNVYRDGILIGYLIQERGKFVTIGKTWFFVGNDIVKRANFSSSNRKKLVDIIESMFTSLK